MILTVSAWLVGPGVAQAITADELQVQIDALMAQLATLQSQLAGLTGEAPTVAGCTITSFDRNLSVGDTGTDVNCLQIVLNSASDTQLASSGVGSPGNETSYFGPLTKGGVIKFQEKYASEVLASWGLTSGTGFVGSTTRAKLNTLLTAVAEEEEEEDITPAVDGTVAVSLAADTPVSTILALGGVGVPVASFNLTSGGDATLDSIKFTRSGLGSATDYANVYIYDGATRLKPGRTISSETETIEFTNIGLALADGTTTKLTVKIDVHASLGAGHLNIISIVSADDISVTGATVEGTFPMMANYMTIGTLAVGTATVADGGTLTKPTIGAAAGKVAKFKITAGNNDIDVSAITLTQDGSISGDHLTNFVLKVGTETVATADSLVNDRVVLTFDTPYEIGKVQSKTFSLYATIGAAKTTDGIRFYLDENTDLTVIDQKYGQGSGLTNSLATANAKCVGSSSTGACTAGSLQGGEVTISDNGPAADTVGRNTTNVALLNFSILTSRDVTVKDYNLRVNDSTDKHNSILTAGYTFVIGTSQAITFDNASGTLEINDYVIIASTSQTSYTTASDVIARVTATNGSTTASVTPVAGTDLTAIDNAVLSTVIKLTSVKLANTDTGGVLYSNSTNRYFYNGASEVNISASDDFDLMTGVTYNLAVKVDISSYSAPDMQLVGAFDLNTANDVKDYNVNEYIAATDIVPNTLTGKTMTVGASSLTVSRASTPVSRTVVKGTSDVDALGVSLIAGSSSDILITNMVVRFLADTTATFGSGTGDTAANTAVQSASLYDGATLVAGPKGLVDSSSWTADTSGDYYKATFDAMSYEIPAGSSQKLTVKVDLKNTITATTYLVATLDGSSDIEAEDSDNNSVTIAVTADGGVNEDDSSATVTNDATPPVQVRVNTAGSLSAKVEGTPDKAIVVAGSNDIVMAKYKFSALNEAFEIQKLDILSDAAGVFATAVTTDGNNIERVGVKVGGTTTWGNLSNGKASLSSLGIIVPSDSYVYVEVVADFTTTVAGATSGATPRLGISNATTNTFRAVGAGSSDTLAYSNVTYLYEASVNAMTVRKTAPTIAKVTGMSTTLNNGENRLYGFTVAADAAEAVSMKGFALKMTSSDAGISSSNFKLYRASTNITDKVLIYNDLGTLEGSTDVFDSTSQQTIYILWDGTTEETVSAGDSKTYYVDATLAGAGAADSISGYMADDAVVLSGAGSTIVGPAAKLVRLLPATENDVAEWSTTAAKYGSYSAKMTKTSGDTDGTTHLEFTPPAGITMAIWQADVTNNSFWHYESATTTANWAQFEFRFEDPNSDGWAEVTAVGLQTTAGVVAWNEETLADGTMSGYGGVGEGGNSFFDWTLAALSTVEAEIEGEANVTEPSDWLLDRVRIELWENSPTRTQYIDNVKIGGVEYGMEEINMLWSDNSNTGHTTKTSDWFNGFLVRDLSTSTHTLSY